MLILNYTENYIPELHTKSHKILQENEMCERSSETFKSFYYFPYGGCHVGADALLSMGRPIISLEIVTFRQPWLWPICTRPISRIVHFKIFS